VRAGKNINLLENVELAMSELSQSPTLLLLDDLGIAITSKEPNTYSHTSLAQHYDAQNQLTKQTFSNIHDSNLYKEEHQYFYTSKDDLFILHTSGSSGPPKSIVHSALGYLVYAYSTFKYVFDAKKDDVYFCTSDIGWITGHSYMVYAPLLHGMTIVLFSGNPVTPNPSVLWQIVEREKVSILYTAPSVIRSLMFRDESLPLKHNLGSLRALASVGEMLGEKENEWFYRVVGRCRCPVLDTWWQTETGGIILAPLFCESIPSENSNGSEFEKTRAGRPFFGVKTLIIDQVSRKTICENGREGILAISNTWPGMCKSSYTENLFVSGDLAVYDDNFCIKILGRADDVFNVCGHRLSSHEFEEVLKNMGSIRESAVVPVKHEIKGEAAFIYVVPECYLENSVSAKDLIFDAITSEIRKMIGAIASPDFLLVVRELPKTRSGKIQRGLLKHIAENAVLAQNNTSHLPHKGITADSPETQKIIEDILSEIPNLYRSAKSSCFLHKK
jgi:acetyl-CoA synthetase